MRIAVTVLLLLMSAAPVLAQQKAEASRDTRVLESLICMILVFGVLYLAVRSMKRKYLPLMERAIQTVDTIEKQNETIIALLQQIARKRQTPEQGAEGDAENGAP